MRLSDILAAGGQVVGEGRAIGCLPLSRHTERQRGSYDTQQHTVTRRDAAPASMLTLPPSLGTSMVFGRKSKGRE
jgi:hypothetical protein